LSCEEYVFINIEFVPFARVSFVETTIDDLKQRRAHIVSLGQKKHLISECEDHIAEEDDTVGNGQRTLGQCQFSGIGLECGMDEIIVPRLNDESTGGNEQYATDQAEEDVDALVDWGRQEITCEQTNQDDGVTKEGTRSKDNGMMISFTQ